MPVRLPISRVALPGDNEDLYSGSPARAMFREPIICNYLITISQKYMYRVLHVFVPSTPETSMLHEEMRVRGKMHRMLQVHLEEFRGSQRTHAAQNRRKTSTMADTTYAISRLK
ncbi:uncharacterized protein LOC101241836 [Hydra vulgaris]|uniref:uncharacterized protein LOC101241836 n=1 Tax=Hydra vulgaris TaxID=6087 RepID=UPI001F5E5ED7|nr:uncharacterized protein LOC101241836 [Hydra vulgaris]